MNVIDTAVSPTIPGVEPYYERDGITIYHGDCRDILPLLSGVSAVVTDPPYGLEFMGVAWDTMREDGTPRTRNEWGDFGSREHARTGSERGRISRNKGVALQRFSTEWAELLLSACLPGTPLLAFGGTRTYHRLVCAIEDAGWEIRDSLAWLYGSGFPKSLDISKAIDKAAPRVGMFADFAQHYAKQRQQANMTHNQICGAGKFYAEHNHGGASVNWEAGYNVPTIAQWNILQPLLGLSSDFLPLIERVEAEREVIGRKTTSELVYAPGEGRDANQIAIDITSPATPLAQLWDGWGTALKPAHEPICLAMKPLDGTFAANAEKHGVAGLNVDGCRIETEDSLDGGPRDGQLKRSEGWDRPWMKDPAKSQASRDRLESQLAKGLGRWPANLIHDGSDEVLEVFPDNAGGSKGGITKENHNGCTMSGPASSRTRQTIGHDDSGSAARFFFCAKASKAERGKGNNHPTVKPLALMSYLCKLVSMPGYTGTLLDPFMGSGSTLLAGTRWFENVIGIERDEEYIKTAIGRIEGTD